MSTLIEEFRTRVLGGGAGAGIVPNLQAKVAELRAGHSSPAGILGGPLATEIREKGLMATARERIRGLTAPPPAPPPPTPEAEIGRPEFVSSEQWERLPLETKEALAEGSGVRYEAAVQSLKWMGVQPVSPGKYQRGRIAVEGC